MGLFSRKARDPEVEAARRKADADIADQNRQERIKQEQARVERNQLAINQRAERRSTYDLVYHHTRHEEAARKAVAKGKADAASVGMTRGQRLLHGAGRVVNTLAGPAPAPGPARAAPAAPPAQGGQQVARAPAKPRPRRTIAAFDTSDPLRHVGGTGTLGFPGLQAGQGGGVAPGLRAPEAPKAGAKRKRGTGIPFLDDPI